MSSKEQNTFFFNESVFKKLQKRIIHKPPLINISTNCAEYHQNTGAENENSTAGDDADQGKTDSAANKNTDTE